MYIIVATCCYFAIIRLECPDYVINSLRVHTVLHREWKFIAVVSYLATVSTEFLLCCCAANYKYKSHLYYILKTLPYYFKGCFF